MQKWFKTHGVHTEPPWLFVSNVYTDEMEQMKWNYSHIKHRHNYEDT